MRYAPEGSLEFNRWLKTELQLLADEVRAALQSNLVALILGGGYGRGRGGVTRVQGQERPYNDLDLVLVVRRKAQLKALAAISQRFAERLGIEVDFSRPLTPAELRTLPHNQMWHDLYQGHQVLVGEPGLLLKQAPAHLQFAPPAREGLRLLLNRGVGLLWAQRVQQGLEEAPDGDFVRRNYFKAALALGDALLLNAKQYDGSHRSSFLRLRRLRCSAELLQLYQQAVRFKRCPDGFAQPGVVEMERLVQRWQRLYHKLQRPGLQEPGLSTPAGWLKNLLRNLRVGRFSLIHPREFLYRRLPQLPGRPQNWSQLFEIWRKYH